MSDSSDRPLPDPDTVVLPAVFVPEGEEVPLEFLADPNPLRIRVTLNPETGELTSDDAGVSFENDLLGQWYPHDAADPGDDGDDWEQEDAEAEPDAEPFDISGFEDDI